MLKKVAIKLDEATDRLTSDEILEICQKVSPASIRKLRFILISLFFVHISWYSLTNLSNTHIVTTGGRLFEGYLDGMSSWATHKRWKDISRNFDPNEIDNMDLQDVQNEIVERERGTFHGFVITSCANIGNKGQRQLFFHTFIARYHGLSRSGCETLSKFGLTMRRTSYDTHRKGTIMTARSHTR